MSEKLDGIRAYWDGKRFISRAGNTFAAPDWFTAGLPDHPLDGELWIGRKRFPDTMSVVRSADAGERWRAVRYLVFDAPALSSAFEQRMEAVRAALSPENTPYAQLVPHELCRGIDHLREHLAHVESLGGEGLMMRQPASRYEVGRSSTLLKIKRFFDAEAKVLGHVAGEGKHKGKLGSLLVENADGKTFNVGTGFTDEQRRAPPPLGAVITFRYQELSESGNPRFPSFVGVRIDSEEASAPAPMPAHQRIYPPPDAQAGPKTRRFENTKDGAGKFWEISQEGASYTVTYGSLGKGGNQQSKSFTTEADAIAAMNKQIRGKLGKGYVEI